ncbi:polyprenyl synthetase family protein [Formicincola oecophyllae]|uniref:Octaprenyl diphosphate synthase n=1 Tax=Formicincola oecophyllae TaxID=2558361 RepID=A0A4Y6UCQ2_9PROT|nr:polyprenyl synthetase family protein [Formicincola oecophyllae]QDH14246.1 polyprenyl synthetase family protein [Formicincola oecophyllae]
MGGENALQALTAWLGEDMKACNQVIMDRMASSVPLIPQVGAYLVSAGGKRLRPLLTLAAARLCGYGGKPGEDRHVRLAACVEFIHTATLLHDDVVDESLLRRGHASANALFGNQASVLVGDFLFSRSFQLMTTDGSLAVMGILANASATIAEGEVLQMTTQNDLSTPVDKYLEVIHGKTAALFAAACRVGVVAASGTPVQEQALERFGEGLGMAFQLVDDALDYVAEQETLGKTVGDDFREGKITLPVLTAWERGTEEDRAFWRRVIERQGAGADATNLDEAAQKRDLHHAMKLIKQTGSIEATLDKARTYADQALAALAQFPESELKSLLAQTLTYTVNRAR